VKNTTREVQDARLRLISKRRELEAQIENLQEDVRGTIGWAPRKSKALMLSLATAAGFALAMGVKRFRG